MNAKERILALLQGEEVDRPACYSGMGNVTTAGLDSLGYKFAEVHSNAKMMADTAATSHKLYGYDCAVVPFDVCLEAEALGCLMNPYEGVETLLYPTIKEKVINSEEEMTTFTIPDNIASRGRIPLVSEAIGLLQKDIGENVAIGTYVLGPFTLAGQLMDLNTLFKLAFKKPDKVNALLDRLADVIIDTAKALRAAGADYVCVREMGATPDVLSPKIFRQVIFPHLLKIETALKDIPTILHICGGTNLIMTIIKEVGANAISIEKKNNMQKTREDIGEEVLIFGNVDSFNILANGTPEEVEKATIEALEAGVDAVWPSCDIWPTAPIENLKKMVETVEKYGTAKWVRGNKEVSGERH
ncbi:MAG TPA: MtaA/CmuA family methyltransferase [Desulfosporosinus sp.]|nr:MtaA/CmuA family methyltransferase [Desulfosporosinus sp.]